MTLCVFCSENVPSEQLQSHMIQFHSSFLPSHDRPHHHHFNSASNHSFISKHNLSSTKKKAPNISSVGHVYDPDILRPLCFLDGKRIKENLKKHKREERSSRHPHKRPHKRRKLNDLSCDSLSKNKKKTKHKRKKKKKDIEAQEIEDEGEEDAYGGLPFHFHLATHCEPKFDPNDTNITHNTSIQSLLNPQNVIPQMTDISMEQHNNLQATMEPCVFNPIHYTESAHLSHELKHREYEWIQQLMKAQDIMTYNQDVTQFVVHANECDMDEETLNDIILADLEQYNFTSNPLNEEIVSRSMGIPPLVTVPDSDSPEIVIQTPIKKKKVAIENKSASLELIAKKSKMMNDRHTTNTSHLTLPTLQTPKQTHKNTPNMSNIPPLNQMMSAPSQPMMNMNQLMNKHIAHNINIGANSQSSTLLKINSMINGQKRKKQDLFHRFGARNHNANRFGNNLIRDMINNNNNNSNHRSSAQILSIQDVMHHNSNPNASPTASNTTSNSTNSLNSINAPNTINIINDAIDEHNHNNNILMNRNDILSVIRKKIKLNQNINAAPTFQQQLNGNYTLARYHQEVNGKNSSNNNNLSLLNNFNCNMNKFARK